MILMADFLTAHKKVSRLIVLHSLYFKISGHLSEKIKEINFEAANQVGKPQYYPKNRIPQFFVYPFSKFNRRDFRLMCYPLISEQKYYFLYTFRNKVKMSFKTQGQAVGQRRMDQSDEVKSIGSWSFHENLLYVMFLQRNKVIMQSKRKRRNLRIFDKMADFIMTRTSLQCRSHHQKFLEKLGDIKTIVTNFKKYMSKEEFRQRCMQALTLRNEPNKQNIGLQNIKLQESNSISQVYEPESPMKKIQEGKQPSTVKSQTESGQKQEGQAEKEERQNSSMSGPPVLPCFEPYTPMGISQIPMNPITMMMIQRQMQGYPLVYPFNQSLMPFF